MEMAFSISYVSDIQHLWICVSAFILIIFRDSRHEIRALCIAEMGEWMKEYRYDVYMYHEKIF